MLPVTALQRARRTNGVGGKLGVRVVVALEVQVRVVALRLSHLRDALEQLQARLEVAHLAQPAQISSLASTHTCLW